jgi:hypothetical protein
VAITIVVVNRIRLRTILPKHLEFQRATAGYSIPNFRRFATRLFANALLLKYNLISGDYTQNLAYSSDSLGILPWQTDRV